MIVALLALFVALGGPAEAARLINGGKIKKGTVGSKQLADGGVKARDLAPGAIDRLTATPPDSIGPLQLGINAVTTDALAPNSVLTGNVADGTLTAADLGINAVGPEEIADNAVGQAQIRPNGVAASEIADGSIDGREVVDGGLSARDIARKVATLQLAGQRASARTSARRKWVPVAGIDLAGSFVLALADHAVAAGPGVHGRTARTRRASSRSRSATATPAGDRPRVGARRRPTPSGTPSSAPRASTGTSRRRPTRPSR